METLVRPHGLIRLEAGGKQLYWEWFQVVRRLKPQIADLDIPVFNTD